MSARNHAQKSGSLRILSASLAVVLGLMVASAVQPARAAEITVYKSPSCGCCGQWVDRMRSQGHGVAVRNMEDLEVIKKMAGVPEALQACHTAFVEGYVIEGHVPADDVTRLLAERPEARGLAVPGMPGGAPGMEGAGAEPYEVLLFQTDGGTRLFASY